MTDVNSIISEINIITTEIKNAFDPFLMVGRNTLGFGALIYICIDSYKVIATGEHDGIANHLKGWAKPLTMSLILLFYNPLLSFCDFIVSPTYSATEGWATDYKSKNEQLEKKFEDDLKAIYLSAKPDTAEAGFHPYDDTINGMKILIQNISLYTSSSYILGLVLMLVNRIVNFCLVVSYLGVLVLQNINLCIIIAFGPIAIGLSMFQPFSDNWKHFFVNYVSKLLWYPVANMCFGIAYRLKNISDQHAYDILLKYAQACVGATTTLGASIASFEAMQSMDWLPIFLSMGVTIVGCFAVIQTPSLVGNIVSGATGGMSASPISGTMALGAMSALAYKAVGGGSSLMKAFTNNDKPNGSGGSGSMPSASSMGGGQVYGMPKSGGGKSPIEL